jgi:hypothetical protein
MALLHDFIYLGTLVFCIVFGEQLRKFKDVNVRKNVATVLGAAIVFMLSGLHIVHPVFMTLVNAGIILYGNPK